VAQIKAHPGSLPLTAASSQAGGFRRLLLLLALPALLAPRFSFPQPGQDTETPTVAQVQRKFSDPPANSRIMMRWWWFGPAVTRTELGREIRAMRAAGIGGFEILPVYPMSLDDPASGIRNLPYLSADFLGALRFVSSEGRTQGMRVDLTLTSGWPYGSPYVPVMHAAGMLRVVSLPLAAGADSVALPSIDTGESLLAAFQTGGDGKDFHHALPRQLALDIQQARLRIAVPSLSQQTVLFFISSRTGQMVKRAAVGGAGFVVDHYGRAAIEEHLRMVADPMLKAFGQHPPYAVFSDSLEVYDSDWTPDLLRQFRLRRGYDLDPFLPALIGDIGPDTAAIRHDWGRTLTELVEDNYLKPVQAWAASHGTRFRSQNYGIPPVTLSSNALVDLAEGENFHWREFSETRWASSANHLYGRPITSAETWTWLHSPAFRGTPLDLKAEADLDFLNGVNQLVGHGWPYSPPSAASPGWSFYAAGAWNDHNPWWFVMPQVTRYFQRVSFALRQGRPINDVAVLLPTDDAWSRMTPSNLSVSEQMHTLIGPGLIAQILDAGLNFDFIDGGAIDRVGIPYRILILPGIQRIPLATYRAIQDFVRRGGTVLATRTLPALEPGMIDADAQSARIQQLTKQLFASTGAAGQFLPDESQLGRALGQALQPDVTISPQTQDIGFVHRRLADGDLYFLVNTSNQVRRFSAVFRVTGKSAEWWDPHSGKATWAADGNSLDMALQPYESRILVFSDHARFSGSPETQPRQAAGLELPSPVIDLSTDWKVRFLRDGHTAQFATLHSWTDQSSTLYYSGQAEYTRTFEIPSSFASPKSSVHLDFGPGVAFSRQGEDSSGMMALLNSPVREAAAVWVNGKPAGSVWCPPYELDVTKLLQPGTNRLRIVVGNLAINEMAGRSAPDYRLLHLFYGQQFTPQDMDHLQSLPAGILGHLLLRAD